MQTPPVTTQLKWGPRILKSLIFAVCLFVLIEGEARLLFSIHRLRRFDTGYDNSSYRLQWIELHRLHLEWTGQYAVYHPIRGWALKPDIRNMSVFNGKILNSNSKGLRGKTEYEYQRTPGKRRIVILGDSFTFGEEVSDDETYSHYLESALPNTEVLNLGVQGYGNDQMLLYLKEEGVKYHPDIVILGFAYLDIYRNLWSFFAYAKPRFKLVPGGLELTNVPVPTPDRVLAEEPYRLKLLDLTVILREKLWWRFGITDTRARQLTKLLFDEIVRTARSIQAVPVFVDMPVGDEIDDTSDSMSGREQFLYAYCKERSIPCLFLRPRFREEINKGVKFQTVGHWNPEAHNVAAQEIRGFLLSTVELAPSAPAGSSHAGN